MKIVLSILVGAGFPCLFLLYMSNYKGKKFLFYIILMLLLITAFHFFIIRPGYAYPLSLAAGCILAVIPTFIITYYYRQPTPFFRRPFLFIVALLFYLLPAILLSSLLALFASGE